VLVWSTYHAQQAGECSLIPDWAASGRHGRGWAVGAWGCETQVEREVSSVDILAVKGSVAVVNYGEGEGFGRGGCGGLGFWFCQWGGESGG